MTDEQLAQLFRIHCQLLAAGSDREALTAAVWRLVHGPISGQLRRWYPSHDEAVLSDGLTTAIVEYVEVPRQARATSGAGVLGFLRLRASSRVRDQLRRDSVRRKAEGRSLDDDLETGRLVRLAGGAVVLGPDGDTTTILERFQDLLDATPDPVDQDLLRMIYLDQIRQTWRYAVRLGLTHLSPEEQRLHVKRHKDRVTGKVKRFFKGWVPPK